MSAGVLAKSRILSYNCLSKALQHPAQTILASDDRAGAFGLETDMPLAAAASRLETLIVELDRVIKDVGAADKEKIMSALCHVQLGVDILHGSPHTSRPAEILY